jgi:hypothetical protein
MMVFLVVHIPAAFSPKQHPNASKKLFPATIQPQFVKDLSPHPGRGCRKSRKAIIVGYGGEKATLGNLVKIPQIALTFVGFPGGPLS